MFGSESHDDVDVIFTLTKTCRRFVSVVVAFDELNVINPIMCVSAMKPGTVCFLRNKFLLSILPVFSINK